MIICDHLFQKDLHLPGDIHGGIGKLPLAVVAAQHHDHQIQRAVALQTGADVAQAELLEDAMQRIGMKLDAVILFEAPEDLLLQRLTARLTCKKCGVAFNKLFAPPKQEGVCDRCGGELIQRADDSLETAKNRLKVYHEQTAPLIQFYEGKGCLARIDSSLPVDKGFAALLALLK